jgi:hypothetical protein
MSGWRPSGCVMPGGEPCSVPRRPAAPSGPQAGVIARDGIEESEYRHSTSDLPSHLQGKFYRFVLVSFNDLNH